MAIYNVYLNNSAENVNFINDLYKYLIILITFHVLMYFTYSGNKPVNFGLTGDLFNPDFLSILFYILISIGFYYLVGAELVSFN